jgi:hypothetical protein
MNKDPILLMKYTLEMLTANQAKFSITDKWGHVQPCSSISRSDKTIAFYFKSKHKDGADSIIIHIFANIHPHVGVFTRGTAIFADPSLSDYPEYEFTYDGYRCKFRKRYVPELYSKQVHEFMTQYSHIIN